ncbi:MAG TPA: S8 family serine peptidase [Thermoanaerobaculia bacterium]
MRGRFLQSLFVLITVMCTPFLFAQEQSDGTKVLDLGRPKQLGVIIEFTTPPLLESRRTQDLKIASASLDALQDQLAKDLARIESQVPGRVAAQAADTGAIRFTYKMVYAGACATVSRESLAAIRALPYVRAVHEEKKFQASLAKSVPHIHAPEVWQQYGTRGKGIVVAIIDTGIDYEHPALGGGFGPGFKVIGGRDLVNGDDDPMDDQGHGTHVAGIVAANSSTLTGVAPEASLLAYKVLDHTGFGDSGVILAGVERAIDPNRDGDPSDHADVVNMSLGGPASPNDPLVAAVERGTAAGVVFSLAAGNSGAIFDLGSPARAPHAITVAASDLEDRVAYFSTGGGTIEEGVVKPEISAPGVNINSAAFEKGTRQLSGTSMAAPHVAGVAALLLEKHPDWTPADVKTAIMSTAAPIVGRGVGVGRPPTDVKYEAGAFAASFGGAGRVDALAAIEATIFPSTNAVTFGVAAPTGGPTTATRTVQLTNRGTAAETLTLQPPAVPAGVTLTSVPESLTLAPGATAEVRLTLEAAPSVVPNDSGLWISGVLTLAGTKTNVRLPWTLVTGDVLEVTVGGSDDFELVITDGNYPATLVPRGPRTFATLVPKLLSSDVLVLTKPVDGSVPRLIIRERQPVEGYTAITVSPDEAIYTIRVDGVDERGVPLSDVAPDAFSQVWHRFSLPAGARLEVRYAEGQRSLRVSPFKEVRLQTYERVDSGSDRYFAAYRHVRKIKNDETLLVRASDWASQRLRAVCPSECTRYLGAGPGSPFGWAFYTLPADMEELTLHLTPQADASYDFRAYIYVREKKQSYITVNPWTFFSNSLRNVNGRFSTSPFGEVSDAEYFPPDRDEPLLLGEGPVTLRVGGGPWFTAADPNGAAGEIFGDERASRVEVHIERVDGGALAPIYASGNPGEYLFRPLPGQHRLVAAAEYPIAGQTGHVTHTSLYDTTSTTDAPPTLTWMRVENGRGVVSTRVSASSPSRVVFAGRQSTIGQGNWMVQHARIDAAATQAWWRPHGSLDWLPLAVTMTGEDYTHKSSFPGSPGTMYSASLAPAVAAEGTVDLKFVIRNLQGATSEITYEPAFLVGSPGTRRRAMR